MRMRGVGTPKAPLHSAAMDWLLSAVVRRIITSTLRPRNNWPFGMIRIRAVGFVDRHHLAESTDQSICNGAFEQDRPATPPGAFPRRQRRVPTLGCLGLQRLGC